VVFLTPIPSVRAALSLLQALPRERETLDEEDEEEEEEDDTNNNDALQTKGNSANKSSSNGGRNPKESRETGPVTEGRHTLLANKDNDISSARNQSTSLRTEGITYKTRWSGKWSENTMKSTFRRKEAPTNNK
jgi:hypothetical protein